MTLESVSQAVPDGPTAYPAGPAGDDSPFGLIPAADDTPGGIALLALDTEYLLPLPDHRRVVCSQTLACGPTTIISNQGGM